MYALTDVKSSWRVPRRSVEFNSGTVNGRVLFTDAAMTDDAGFDVGFVDARHKDSVVDARIDRHRLDVGRAEKDQLLGTRIGRSPEARGGRARRWCSRSTCQAMHRLPVAVWVELPLCWWTWTSASGST